ncbi:MAG: Hpt domain-containing protein [Devosiaceae bacterium]
MDPLSETIKKGEYKTITPPDTLQKKVRQLSGRDAKIDPVAKAEEAVERLSVNFADWMDEEVQRLVEIWQDSQESGLSEDARGKLYRAAHDMRGQGATLGFPSVGKIAGVFCDILDTVGEQHVPDHFMEKYITAIRAIARETKAGEDNSLAHALANELSKAGAELIEKHDTNTAKTKAA